MNITPTVFAGRQRDLGDGFVVSRLLPELQARHVGPLVFFDQMGPVRFPGGKGVNVRPHPHIGLATVTWLFAGTIRHRDSLGSLADIRPGEVNWMTAGRGIVHSERTPPEALRDGQSLHGVQIWVALPQDQAEVEPEFHHHGAGELPRLQRPGAELVLIAGSAYGAASPVKVYSPMFLLEARLEAGATLELPGEHRERGVFVVDGEVEWDGQRVAATQMAVQAGDTAAPLHAGEASRLILFGGAPLDGERELWWNFVAADPGRIEQAKADWSAGRFGTVPGDEKEFIPLPER